MKNPSKNFALNLAQGVTDAVRRASILKTRDRIRRLAISFADIEAARTKAATIKDAILADLENNLAKFIGKATENGIVVHTAETAEDARRIILDLCGLNPGGIVKGKSMATEEIHLNQALIDAGMEVVETDLGEYVVQIDGDLPSHIVTPIIHKNRVQVAESFLREGLGEYTEDPAQLALQARWHLRSKFREASVGISGVNFAVVDSGRLVIVENEGNNRLSTTVPQIHIAVMGIEKLIPSESDLPLFLKLLAGSATGQAITTYTHLIQGPRQEGDLDGPREVHLVLLDAGRREILESRYRSILRCIRCGACLNVCPVYRQISGHGYGHVYPGPIGAVLAPLLEKKSGQLRQLPKASTLCGSCEEVCPVKIPIPDMLLHLRDEAGEKGSWEPFAQLATNSRRWNAAKIGARIGPAVGWEEFRTGPESSGRSFRTWWNNRDGDRERQLKANYPEEICDPAPKYVHPTAVGVGALWDRFVGAFSELGGELLFADSIGEGLKLAQVDLDSLVADSDVGVVATSGLWEAQVGVTWADCAVAETASLVIVDNPERARLHSLVPPHHVAFVRRGDIIENLEDAGSRCTSSNTVWVTGPSRTADIEGVLVRGVHGPGRVTVIVLPDF